MLLDKEMEALVKCTELIKDLDDEAKLRVMKYLVERFGIGIQRPTFEHHSQRVHQEPISQIDTGSEDTSYEDIDEEQSSYPSMRDIVIKDLPKNEAEWALIYGLYASQFGQDSFTREGILKGYEDSKRATQSRKNNLSHSISKGINEDWYKSLNDTEFIFKEKGLSYAKEILAGKSAGFTRKKGKKKSTNSDSE